ncbi:BNR-repeat neuraminidase N-terminal domain-containing protein, partial [Proteiniphilum sp. UBA5346]
AGENDKLETDHPVGEVQPTATKITFSNHFTVTEDTTILWVSVTLKKSIDLSHKIKIRCEEIVTDRGKLKILPHDAKELRAGVALRQHGQDGVHTSRIPG